MDIIPVIDLKGGVVVRARRGDRASYPPIETPLSPTSDPLDVVSGLLALHPFRTLYVADLDAIEGLRGHAGTINRIIRRFPALDLWLDNGCSEVGQAERLLAHPGRTSLVIGSESQRDGVLLARFRDNPRILLSLDFRGEQFLGPPPLLEEEEGWPTRLIVMTLSSVGSDAGPDFARFSAVRRRAGPRRVYMAGGLRGGADLAAVKAGGAAGILVASALHDRRLSPADLAANGRR